MRHCGFASPIIMAILVLEFWFDEYFKSISSVVVSFNDYRATDME